MDPPATPSEALPHASAEMPPKEVRKPRGKQVVQTATADPPLPPALVADAPFFAALGGTLRCLQTDDRQAKLAVLRIT